MPLCHDPADRERRIGCPAAATSPTSRKRRYAARGRRPASCLKTKRAQSRPRKSPTQTVSETAVEPDSRAARRAARRRRRLERATQAHDPDEPLDSAAIAERLRAPTRTVSESELRADYAYVLRDLRGMAILAAALIGALFLLALGFGV